MKIPSAITRPMLVLLLLCIMPDHYYSEYLLIASRSRVRLLAVWWRYVPRENQAGDSHGGGFDQHGEIYGRKHKYQMINGFGDGCSLVGAFEDGR